jgi:hypothetical protein
MVALDKISQPTMPFVHHNKLRWLAIIYFVADRLQCWHARINDEPSPKEAAVAVPRGA